MQRLDDYTERSHFYELIQKLKKQPHDRGLRAYRKSTIKKRAHMPLRASLISQTNVSVMFDNNNNNNNNNFCYFVILTIKLEVKVIFAVVKQLKQLQINPRKHSLRLQRDSNP